MVCRERVEIRDFWIPPPGFGEVGSAGGIPNAEATLDRRSSERTYYFGYLINWRGKHASWHSLSFYCKQCCFVDPWLNRH